MPNAVPKGDGTEGLQPLGLAVQASHLALAPLVDRKPSTSAGTAPTSATLFDQGLVLVLQLAVSGLEPRQPYVLALSANDAGTGPLQPHLER